MMKCIFVVLLLHVCCSVPLNAAPTSFTPDVTTTSFTPDVTTTRYIPDPNLNREILSDLGDLNKSINHTMLKFIRIPGDYMLSNASKCVDAFSRALRHFLGNLKQDDAVQAIIERLVPKLKLLAKHPQNNSMCKMIWVTRVTRMTSFLKGNPFKKHIEFIKKLNSGR